jgi:lysozyme
METMVEQLIRHEGLRLKAYKDSVGKLTIGIGRNLDDSGISLEEAMMMLENDINRTIEGLKERLPWFGSLDRARQNVLINMAFNMGIHGLLGFKRMLVAIKAGNYEVAAGEMLQSAWAGQVGGRAVELSNIMKNGL